MIWHIFKKDLRLTWKVVLVSALLQWTDAVLVVAMGIFGEHAPPGSPALRLDPIRQIIHVMAFVAVVLAAVSVVQNDRFTTCTDDWLVRPIRRRDAMLAKFLFFVVAIMGPTLVGSGIAGIALGLGLSDSIRGAVLHGLATAVCFGPFGLAVGALASGMLEAVVGVLGCVVLFAVMLFAGNAMRSASYYGDHRATVFGALTVGIALSGLVGFGLQFYRHRTRRSRVISLAVFAAGVCIGLLPPTAAAALSRSVSGLSPAAWRFSLTLDPHIARERGIDSSPLPTRIGGDTDLSWLAFRINGLGTDEWVAEDRRGWNEAVVTNAEGEVRRKHAFTVSSQGIIWLGVYGNGERNLQHAVRVTYDYAFYVLRQTGTHAVPAIGSDASIPGLGRCGIRDLTASYGQMDFICATTLPESACYYFRRDGDERYPHLPFCGETESSFLSWLWDWNRAQQTSISVGNSDYPKSLVVQERVGYLGGHLDLDSVQPQDWWVPPAQ